MTAAFLKKRNTCFKQGLIKLYVYLSHKTNCHRQFLNDHIKPDNR